MADSMLSNSMRILLIIGAMLYLIYIVHKIRKSQIIVAEAIFWMWVSVLIAILGIFPSIPINLALYIGVESPANFVYLVFITLLLVKVFLLSLKISMLEEKVKKLAQKIALIDKDLEKNFN